MEFENYFTDDLNPISSPEKSLPCFDCSICLDFAKDPVVTLCGHLYCWPCIYKWLSFQTDSDNNPLCPVCKSEISHTSVVPLYGRGKTLPENEPDTKTSSAVIPPRPHACLLTTPDPTRQFAYGNSQYRSYDSSTGVYSHGVEDYNSNVWMYGEMIYARVFGNSQRLYAFPIMVTGIGPSLYKSGKECGACYEIKCTKHPSCSRKPARVVITDFCPGGPCASDHAHFDLSGTAFGAMAKPGQEKHLRDAGVLKIRFARVKCDYSRTNLVFHVDQGSNPNYFAFVVEFEEGDGDLAGVSLKEESSDEWLKMVQSWGAVWKVDPGRELHPPFSIRLISQYSQQVLVAKNVIPTGWTPGATYRSLVNYL